MAGCQACCGTHCETGRFRWQNGASQGRATASPTVKNVEDPSGNDKERSDRSARLRNQWSRRGDMAVSVVTNDASALTDGDLDEMGSMGGAFDIGAISKAKEDWVLATTARIEGKLHGFMFSTLERIGGTPCVLLGLISVKRTTKRDQVLRGLMKEAYHRALMAFPDEDVVVGSRFVSADALIAFKDLDDVTPRPGVRAVGEERAWGRRLAKRFDCDAGYDEQAFVVKT